MIGANIGDSNFIGVHVGVLKRLFSLCRILLFFPLKSFATKENPPFPIKSENGGLSIS